MGTAGQEESANKLILTGGGGPGVDQATPCIFPQLAHVQLNLVLVVLVVSTHLGSKTGSEQEAARDQQHESGDSGPQGTMQAQVSVHIALAIYICMLIIICS